MKNQRTGWILVGVLCAAIVAAAAGVVYFWNQGLRREAREEALNSLFLKMKEGVTVEYGAQFDPSSVIENYEGTLELHDDVDPQVPGSYGVYATVSTTDQYGVTVTKNASTAVEVKDTALPVIVWRYDSVTVTEGSDFDPLEQLISVCDPVDGDLAKADALAPGCYVVTSDVDMGTTGNYTVTIEAQDRNGNTASSSMAVVVQPLVSDPDHPYYIRVNRAANTVTVYMTDQNGNPAVPFKAMVCSTGTATPLGTYRMDDWRQRWNALFGGVWGQYSSGIVGDILFHSVPYYSRNIADLEYEEYNKLGTAASMGCVRLCVADAKWIHENCPIGTVVEFYDDPADPGPLGKPEPVHIDVNDSRRGWDPTDPDPANPWKTNS